MLLLDLQHQCRVGLLHFTLGGQLCMCSSVCCARGSGTGGVEGGWSLVLAGRVGKGAASKPAQAAALACGGLFPHLQEPINLSIKLDGIWGAVSFPCSHF